MDPRSCDDIRSRLDRYAKAVLETRRHAAERSSFGRYRAGAPYFEQYPLRAALEAADGNMGPLDEFWAEYDRITRDLESPGFGGNRTYREELYRDLVACVEMYRSMVCCHELGFAHDAEMMYPARREEIGILLDELRREFPLDGIEREVRLLDRAWETLRDAGKPEGTGNSRASGSPGPVTGYPVSHRKKGQAGAR